VTLYRVLLPVQTDEAAAYAFRERVAEIGFNDARVLRRRHRSVEQVVRARVAPGCSSGVVSECEVPGP